MSRRRERRGEEYLIFSSNTACIYHLSLGFRRTISKSTFCTRHTHMSSRCRLSGRKICAGVLHVAAIYTKRGRRRVYSALFLQSFSEGHLIRHCVFFFFFYCDWIGARTEQSSVVLEARDSPTGYDRDVSYAYAVYVCMYINAFWYFSFRPSSFRTSIIVNWYFYDLLPDTSWGDDASKARDIK